MSWTLKSYADCVVLEAPTSICRGWWLCHTMTQERIALPAPPDGAQYLLDFNEDGWAFVDVDIDDGSDEGKFTRWAQDLFKQNLYVDDKSQQLFLRSPGGKTMAWLDFVSDRFEVTIKLKVGSGNAASQPVRAAMFRKAEGCRVWWCIGDFHRHCGMGTKDYASRWVSSLWQRWQRYVDSVLSLGKLHLRLSNLRSDNVMDGRVLPYASVSTVALIALFMRFIALHRARGGLHNVDSRQAVRELVVGMLRDLPTTPVQYVIGLGTSAETWHPPKRYVHQEDSIAVQISSSTVSMSMAHAQSLMVALKVRDDMTWATTFARVDAALLLLDVAKRTSCAGSIFAQFVIVLGSSLDTAFAAEYLHARGAPTSLRDDRLGVLVDVGWSSPHAVQENLMKYWLSGQKHFQNASFMSLSADDSRVGGFSRMVIAAVLDTNMAMFLPPQVPVVVIAIQRMPLLRTFQGIMAARHANM